jgi:putative transposase
VARKPRIHYPGAVYHVILRGNAGQDIFFADEDRYRFYRFLQEGRVKFGHRIHAFCLMTNHVHLALQVGEIPLSRIIQNLSQRYTMWVNWREDRKGHLFQGRYKAILLDADRYLLELIRYIHLNPVRAGAVKQPKDYRWSSHRVYLREENLPWLTTDWVLNQFSNGSGTARQSYQQFVNDGIGERKREEFYKGSGDGRILADDRFAERILHQAKERIGRKVTLDEIMEKVCSVYGLEVEEVISPGKRRGLSQARGMICWLARETGYLSLTELSKRFKRDLSALSAAIRRLAENSRTDIMVAERMAKLKSELV